jgi:hypothetical protein
MSQGIDKISLPEYPKGADTHTDGAVKGASATPSRFNFAPVDGEGGEEETVEERKEKDASLRALQEIVKVLKDHHHVRRLLEEYELCASYMREVGNEELHRSKVNLHCWLVHGCASTAFTRTVCVWDVNRDTSVLLGLPELGFNRVGSCAAVTQWMSTVGRGWGELGSCAYIASRPGAFGVLCTRNWRGVRVIDSPSRADSGLAGGAQAGRHGCHGGANERARGGHGGAAQRRHRAAGAFAGAVRRSAHGREPTGPAGRDPRGREWREVSDAIS